MSNILERFKRLATLKQKNPDDFSIDEVFEINSLSLANINAIQEMARGDGWELVATMMENEYNKSQKAISQLAFAPEKNATQLITHSAISETLKRIYDTVYKTVDEKKKLENQRKQLLQTKRRIR